MQFLIFLITFSNCEEEIKAYKLPGISGDTNNPMGPQELLESTLQEKIDGINNLVGIGGNLNDENNILSVNEANKNKALAAFVALSKSPLATDLEKEEAGMAFAQYDKADRDYKKALNAEKDALDEKVRGDIMSKKLVADLVVI